MESKLTSIFSLADRENSHFHVQIMQSEYEHFVLKRRENYYFLKRLLSERWFAIFFFLFPPYCIFYAKLYCMYTSMLMLNAFEW